MPLGQSQALTRNFPLYLYGNNCIQNSRYIIGSYPRFATPFEIQRTPIARGAGSTVVNKKEKEKEINFDEVEIMVGSTATGSELEMQNNLERFKNLMSYDNRYLRVMPTGSYVVLHNPSATTGWSLSADGTGLALDTTEFQLDSASLSFNTTVTGANSVNISSTTQTGQNLSTYLSNNTLYLPQFERWVYIPDETEVTNIDIRVGSSNANYYSKTTIITNYEGKALTQGWNYISVPYSSMTTTGTPNNSSLGTYQYVQFNYQSTTGNLTGFRIDGLMLVNDANIRNYRSYRNGEIEVKDNAFRQKAILTSFNLLNYTGYAESTQTETLFSQTGVTTLSNTQTVTLNGNRDLLPTIGMTLNTVTNLSQLKLSNLNNGQFIYFGNTWTAGDTVQVDNLNKFVTRNGNAQDFSNGRLPIFSPGRNKVRMEVIQNSNSVLSYLGYDSESILFTPANAHNLAQSFVAPISGTLTSFSVVTRGFSPAGYNNNIAIRSDISGNPASVLYLDVVPSTLDFQVVNYTINSALSVTAGTTYWIDLTPSSSSTGCWWKRNSTGPYSSGVAKSYNGAAWTTLAGDLAFEAVIEPTPSTNINWNMSYKRLYN